MELKVGDKIAYVDDPDYEDQVFEILDIDLNNDATHQILFRYKSGHEGWYCHYDTINLLIRRGDIKILGNGMCRTYLKRLKII